MKDIAIQAARLKEQLEHHTRQQEKQEMSASPVTKKKTSTKAAEPAETKVTKKKTALKSVESTKQDTDGLTTINELAVEFKTSSRQIRMILRKAGVEKPEGFRYAWKPESKDLKAVRAAIEKGLEPSKEV